MDSFDIVADKCHSRRGQHNDGNCDKRSAISSVGKCDKNKEHRSAYAVTYEGCDRGGEKEILLGNLPGDYTDRNGECESPGILAAIFENDEQRYDNGCDYDYRDIHVRWF